jgi:hypothetical protein
MTPARQLGESGRLPCPGHPGHQHGGHARIFARVAAGASCPRYGRTVSFSFLVARWPMPSVATR